MGKRMDRLPEGRIRSLSLTVESSPGAVGQAILARHRLVGWMGRVLATCPNGQTRHDSHLSPCVVHSITQRARRQGPYTSEEELGRACERESVFFEKENDKTYDETTHVES